MKDSSDDRGDLVSQDQFILDRIAADIQITVLQTKIFQSIRLIGNDHRCRLGTGKHLAGLSYDFDLAGRKFRVRVFLNGNCTFHFNDVFVSDIFDKVGMRLIKGDLGDAVTVSQIDKDDGTEVPSLGNPAGKLYMLARIAFS